MGSGFPTTLEELAALLERATTAGEIFGGDLEGRYRRYALLCHPDRFPAGPDQEKAARVFRRLVQWLEVAKAAELPETLRSPSRQYVVLRRLAVGDLADVHLAEADGRHYVLKIPRFRAGCRLIEREARHLKAMDKRCGDRRYREYLPRLVETFTVPGSDGDRQANVFAYHEGFYTLEQIRRRHPDGLDARHLAWIFKRMLAVVGFSAVCGLVHGALVPPHVLIHAENHGLQLLDWIHAVRVGQPLVFVPTAYRQWYPSEALAKKSVSPATDLFLAAKCLIYVAGGDPVAEQWPESVPMPMQRFLNTCLFPSPRMRPQDAWQLHEEFDALLVRLFGAPRYHRLVMS
jgi:hypothetical protein